MIEQVGEAPVSRRGGNEAARRSLAFLDDLVRGVPTRNFSVRLWDGTEWELRAGEHEFTLVLRHPGALRAMFWRPNELKLAEAYIYDDFDVEGDLRAFVAVAHDLLAADIGRAQRARQAVRLLALSTEQRERGSAGLTGLRGRRDSLARARRAVSYHYDTSNEFFALFLDPRLVYTCAYFSAADESVDAAQERKLEYVCRKLRLQRGDRLLDVGCGWGSLALYAAERYGARVLGVTLSEAQAELGNKRIAAAGLADRARVELRDFRELDEPDGFDKIAAVGFIEHLGEDLLPDCFSRLFSLLRPGGVFLNHAIARRVDFAKPSREVSFLGRYVFPDAELTPIGAVLRAAEDAGFEVRDVESLREHYALTVGRWLDRLEERHEQARRLTSETTYRVFRLYLAGSAHTFETGGVNLYQALLAKPDSGASGLPLLRSDWYA